jgi:3',5'-nucleoside bisphosphate phosphatase
MNTLDRSDPWRVNADLHSHSRVSDGDFEPAALAARAAEKGVQVWALTDHDELEGLAEAAQAAAAHGLRFIPGVEISVTWASQTVHILGLGIDPQAPELQAGLSRTRAGRIDRARQMADELGRVGIGGAFEGAMRHAGNPAMISRTHFAKYLVEGGHCKHYGEVFERYLTEGKPGFVEHRWARLSDAVSWINAAGGVAVVAHPARYRFGDTESWAFFEEFREAGGQGIEVVSSSHSKDEIRRFGQLAREHGFVGSRGSDFHSTAEPHTELGRAEPLPHLVEPVWARWL